MTQSHVATTAIPERIEASINGLRHSAPHMSAHRVISRPQAVVLAAAVVLVLISMAAAPIDTLRVVLAVITVGYLLAVGYRLVLIGHGLNARHSTRVSDEEARAVPDLDLPRYSILIPAYKEPEVIGKVISSMSQLDYPRDRLEIFLLLEADDHQTIKAALAANISSNHTVEIVLVPPEGPRTKPKACNYGLQSATGEFVTIYDAEDIPEPLQLRRAVVALRRLGDQFVCVQAQLGYFNVRQNLITRWFSVEYANWFQLLLPGLIAVGAPIPLGGTSNHFRTDKLRELGAWDPYNVTEDADLGIRLARLGYSVGVLESATLEEANSDTVNWLKQRSRWYKGYLQTWLVHMRNPVVAHRQLGWRGSVGLHLFVAGTPLATFLNPFFWALTIIWFVEKPAWITELYPASTFYLALTCFVLGNAAIIYASVLTTRIMREPGLLGAAVLTPIYWVLMSVAAAKATFQLLFHPSYWEKTTHGLSTTAGMAESATPVAQAGVPA